MLRNSTSFGSSVLLVLAIVAAPLFAPGTEKDQVGSFQEELRAAYNRLTAMKKWDALQDSKLKLDIANLTNNYVLARLNAQTRPNSATLEADLNEAFSQAIGHMSAEELQKFWGEAHYVTVLDASPRSDAFIIGYMIPHGNTSVDVIEIAQLNAGSYRFSARGGAEMQDHTLRLHRMRPRAEKVRFLAYGQRLGANQSPLSLVLYEFDDSSLSPLWTRSGLWQGAVGVADGTVTLTFQNAARFQNDTPPYFQKEEYSESDSGLKLISREWVDAP